MSAVAGQLGASVLWLAAYRRCHPAVPFPLALEDPDGGPAAARVRRQTRDVARTRPRGSQRNPHAAAKGGVRLAVPPRLGPGTAEEGRAWRIVYFCLFRF